MRSIVTSALIGVAAASIGFGYFWWADFDPATCSQQRLWIWLVQNDIESLSDRKPLVDRLEKEILDGLEVPESTNQLSEKQVVQLNSNIEKLQYDWFRQSVDEFLESGEQVEVIDRKLGVLMNWPTTPTPDGSSPSAADFFGKVKGWIQAEQPPLHDQMNSAVQKAVERWLIKYDLRDQPEDVQIELTSRIADELNAGLVPGLGDANDESPEENYLEDNILLLMKTWFHQQAAGYANCDSDQQSDFINQRLDEVFSWELDSLLGGAAQGNATTKLLGYVNQWIDEASPDRKGQLQQFAAAAKGQVMLRIFSGKSNKN